MGVITIPGSKIIICFLVSRTLERIIWVKYQKHMGLKKAMALNNTKKSDFLSKSNTVYY